MPTDASSAEEATSFLNIGFADLSYDEALEQLRRFAKDDRFSFVVTANVDHVNRMNSKHDRRTAAALNEAYGKAVMRLCDSKILAALARICGIKLHIVPGSDLTASLFEARFYGAQKVAIVGGDEQTQADLQRLFPGPDYVVHVPPMGILHKPAAIEDVVNFVAHCKADYSLFAIGCPQSEVIAVRCLEREGSRGVGLCIGASIDFLRGKQTRAPMWMRHMGLEWAHRLIQEPKRMWRRYLLEGPRIFLIALKWQLRRARAGRPA
jgi:N-acetylglucosaminyldiphosphoundecaprenol N-acetyl-beta-D-mannosaminyltransferase